MRFRWQAILVLFVSVAVVAAPAWCRCVERVHAPQQKQCCAEHKTPAESQDQHSSTCGHCGAKKLTTTADHPVAPELAPAMAGLLEVAESAELTCHVPSICWVDNPPRPPSPIACHFISLT